jgi:hypothetical protein
MIDQTSPFSFNIRQAFLDDIIKHGKPSLIDNEEENQSTKHHEIENQPPIKA